MSPSRRVAEVTEIALAGGLDDLPEVFLGGDTEGVEVLHEDAHVWALSKPSGIPVVPDRASGRGSCLGFLVRRELASRAGKTPAEFVRPRIVHRIDRLTSGLVLVARTPDAERALGAAFESGRVRKEYIALLEGDVAATRTVVSCPVAPARKGRMRAGEEGKASVTELEVIERFGGTTLVVALPRTGRTHQIRVHCAALGHPVVADPLYGARAGEGPAVPISRLALHAWRCTLPGEWPGARAFTSPPADDLREAVRRLRGG